MPKVDYQKEFETLLRPYCSAGTSLSADVLFADRRLGGVSKSTKLKQLKKFLSKNMEFFGCVQGILPSVAALIDLAEQKMGASVSEANVVRANRICAGIVTKAFGPVVGEFVRSGLGQFISDDELQIPVPDLLDFLVGEFASFMKGAGNGLVSVAGGINEKLLARCLTEKGLNESEFSVTGTKSEGDIVVHSKAGAKSNLNVEIKSYHARERLLRGLKDIERPKVGAGYFVAANEFNPSRTIDLLQSHAAAIYMPQETLSKLDAKSASAKTNDSVAFGSRFYRPLEQFASDMLHFARRGELPLF
jgi:hypothetical protein